MKLLKRCLAVLFAVLRALLYGWLLALIELAGIIRQGLQACLVRLHLPGRLARTSTAHCVKISDPAFKRPDPMIYDQYYLMSQGISVTWDNPDIHFERGGVMVPPYALEPDAVYDVVARIWNNSTEAPVVDLPVRFSYLSFGIGTESHVIGLDKVPHLGVKGGPGHPAFATLAWRTPATPGHYCVQVQLEWFDDANPSNNLGQTNTQVVAAHSPAEFSFQLRNASRQRREYRFEFDAYLIPPVGSCDRPPPRRAPPPGSRARPGTVLVIPPRHDRHNAPQLPGWTIAFEPSNPVLGAGEEITVHGTATPPSGFHGRQSLNVNAFDSAGLAGGVSIYIDVP